MFKKDLKERLHKIFQLKKTTFDSYSDAFEQDTLFIEINSARSNISQGRAKAYVDGFLVVFGKHEALPFGEFQKKIQRAKPELTAPLFFYDVDVEVASSPARMVNLSERRTRFVFLFSEVYDAKHGELTSVDFCNE